MGKIKQAGVCAGIAVGSVIGGTVSMIGKMTDKRVIDELGENIMDSTILTGEIVGEAASGATNFVTGKIKKQPLKVKKGKKELGKAGGRVVENAVTNIKSVADQSGEILEGIKMKDKKRMAKGLRTLGKMAVVGMLTVGAIKVDEIAEPKSEKLAAEPQQDYGEANAAKEHGSKAPVKDIVKSAGEAAKKAADIDPAKVTENAAQEEEGVVSNILTVRQTKCSGAGECAAEERGAEERTAEERTAVEHVTEECAAERIEAFVEQSTEKAESAAREPELMKKRSGLEAILNVSPQKSEEAEWEDRRDSMNGKDGRDGMDGKSAGLSGSHEAAGDGGTSDLNMEALLKKQPSLEEELDKKIRF